MKTWKEVKTGDTVYYYDHCTMKEQYVHSAELQTYEEVHVDWYNPKRKTIEEKEKLVLVVGPKKITIEITEYQLKRSDAWTWCQHRFCCKEAAETFMKDLIDRRIAKAKYLQEKLDKQLNILCKYSKNNKDFDICIQ